ncbi:MAG: hypothetical protein U0231_15095 [Nitrospiraceae bacterium]
MSWAARRCIGRGCTTDVTTTMIKPNRGRDWLDWQRKVMTAGKWVGLAAVLLMLDALLFGEMGISRYICTADALGAARARFGGPAEAQCGTAGRPRSCAIRLG